MSDQPSGKPSAARASFTLTDLIRWQDHGATWRSVDVSDQRAVVELRTCYGEPVDTVQGEDGELIAYVRAHRAG